MANVAELSNWEAGIYQLETTDPVQGGVNGIDNLQAKQLANRSLWLKNALASTDADVAALTLLIPTRTVLAQPLVKGHFIATVPGTTFALSAAEAPIGSIVILNMRLKNAGSNAVHSITGPNNGVSLFLNGTASSEIQGTQFIPITNANDRSILHAYTRNTLSGVTSAYGEIQYGGFF